MGKSQIYHSGILTVRNDKTPLPLPSPAFGGAASGLMVPVFHPITSIKLRWAAKPVNGFFEVFFIPGASHFLDTRQDFGRPRLDQPWKMTNDETLNWPSQNQMTNV
jgi:hypothetical protein